MQSAIDYNSVVWNEQNDIQDALKRINFYLSSNVFAKLFRRIGTIKLVKKDIKVLEVDMLKRSLVFMGFSIILKQNFDSYVDTDLSEKIGIIQKEINKITKALETIESYTEEFGTSPFNFSNLIFSGEKLLESYYDILRLYKRANKKVLAPPSELARQTAAFSMNNLSRVLNNDTPR